MLGAAGAGLHGDRRQQAAFGHFDRGLRHIDIVARAEHGGMLMVGRLDRRRHRQRRKAIDRRCRHKLAGRLTDHLGIGRLADSERHLGGIEIGKPPAQPCFGLGGIGRRNVAGVEAFPRGRLDLTQHVDIGALRLDQRLIGHDVHVGRDRIEQHALPGVA